MRLLDTLVSPSRFGQFISVGAAGAVVDLTVSSALTITGVAPPEWAKVGGAECAIVLMFLINDRWTFTDYGTPGVGPTLRRLLRSNLVRSVGLVVQFVVVKGLTQLDFTITLGQMNIWALVTMPIAIGCAVLVNYVAESLLTWQVQTDT